MLGLFPLVHVVVWCGFVHLAESAVPKPIQDANAVFENIRTALDIKIKGHDDKDKIKYPMTLTPTTKNVRFDSTKMALHNFKVKGCTNMGESAEFLRKLLQHDKLKNVGGLLASISKDATTADVMSHSPNYVEELKKIPGGGTDAGKWVRWTRTSSISFEL